MSLKITLDILSALESVIDLPKHMTFMRLTLAVNEIPELQITRHLTGPKGEIVVANKRIAEKSARYSLQEIKEAPAWTGPIVLSDSVNVSDEFRAWFNDWAVGLFGGEKLTE